MDLTNALMNLGGPFVLAAALLVLHREALRQFREEMQREREFHRDQAALERTQCHNDHEQIMGAVRENTAAVAALSTNRRHS